MNHLFIALGIALAAALIVGGMDRRDAGITAQHVSAAAEKKADVRPADRLWMMRPLDCTDADATVNTRTLNVEPGQTRCYFRTAR